MRSLKLYPIQSLFFLLCFFSGSVSAGHWNILVNGKAQHTKSSEHKSYNEDNWGAGIQYDFGGLNQNWIKFLSASGFLDSNNEPSYYGGMGLARRFVLAKRLNDLHVDFGLVGFVMTRKDHRDGQPFPGVLPMMSIGTSDIALNITYVPEVHPKMVELWFFQFKLARKQFW